MKSPFKFGRVVSGDAFPGRGYRYYNNAANGVALPFGFGLSYVSFDCFGLTFDASQQTITFEISNMGSQSGLTHSFGCAASAAVLGYWEPTQPSDLLRRVVAFEQVADLPGNSEARTVSTQVYEEFMIHKEYGQDGQFVFGGAKPVPGDVLFSRTAA